MINLLLNKLSDQILQQLFKELFDSVTIKVRRQVSDYPAAIDPYVQSSIFIHNIRFETKKYVDIHSLA